MKLDFRRVAIVNRGEPAMRLIHAVREYARETGKEMRTIAFFTEPDRHSMFVREADEAVSLGEAFFVDPRDNQRKSSYLDYTRLQEALLASGAQAAWVGWGFVAEHPAFVELCHKLGVVFIGPSAEVMRKLGDKITAKRIAEAARVPVAPWSGGPVDSLDEARAAAERIGFPLMIKATSGGGGRGIRRVRSMDELEEAFDRSRSEALRGFGDPTVFLERMVRQARHVEVQIIGDRHGNVWAAGVRDCSVQRRNQKVIEESGSTALNSLRERKLRDAAVRLCKSAGYFGAGTVEFLYDPRTREMAFMEVNARLQVEHPVTEQTTGLDLVKLQLHVAQGGKLEGKAPTPTGYAIEVRLNAEDPDNGFAPAPGKVELFRAPSGPGIRIDTGVEEGDRIASEFDSMIAKIIASGSTRAEAIARMERALSETTIVVQGGTTNKAFLLELLARPDYREGRVDITWLDRLMASGERAERPYAEAALLQAAIEVSREDLDAERRTFLFSAYRGRPQVTSKIGSKVELRYRGNPYTLNVYCLGTSSYRVEVEGARIDVEEEMLGCFERRLTLAGRTHRVVTVADGVDHLVEIDGVPHRVSRDDGGMVRSPAPAVVVALRVRVGDDVRAGDTIAILEAMKTEMPVTAPFSGKIREIKTTANEQVAAGAPILQIEPDEAEDTAPIGARLSFGVFDGSRQEQAAPRERAIAALKELQRLALGYDVDPQTSRRLIAVREEAGAGLRPDDEGVLLEELTLLSAFADVAYLGSRQPEPLADEPGLPQQSPQQALFTFTRALDAKGEGLPKRFVAALERALKHYEVTDLARTPDLEEALVWMFKAHTRIEHQIGATMSVLDRLLRDAEVLRAQLGTGFRDLLGRVIAVSRDRFRGLEDLAREVRYAYFDKPLLEATRQRVYGGVIDDLRRVAREPEMDERGRLVSRVVDCPQPLLGLLTDHYRSADLALRHLILETLVRRYYRTWTLENVRVITVEGHSIAAAETIIDDERTHLLAMFAARERVARLGSLLVQPLREIPEDHRVVLDLYVRVDDENDTPETIHAWAVEAVNTLVLPHRLERIVVSVTGFPTAQGPGQTHFTFLPAETGDGYVEEPLYRGVHPLMAQRIGLHRLSNFALQRLPSAEDVYLFLAVAKENPKDERLFALAEVRDLTPRKDREGRTTGLPLMERMLLETCAAIRRVQSSRSAESRLYMNRIILHVWPVLDFTMDEIAAIARRLAPATSGLGIEKVVLRVTMRTGDGDATEAFDLHLSNPGGRGIKMQKRLQSELPIRPLTPYRQKVVTMQRRGLHYPFEIVRLLTPTEEDREAEFPLGAFVEYDFLEDGSFAAVDRPWGNNTANVVVGLITNKTAKHEDGMTRVIVLGDPSRSLGSLAEPECRRILAALDLAEERGIPVEWFAVSAGAKISMQSGTENMDWIALVLRRIVLFTQGGGEINVIVHGVNVGAQPYWNAEATMLMHTRGILVMTPDGAMVLTGKKALDYSGGVSAEDNHGIGGYDRVMGPNGQAQYWARDLAEACHILLRHYEHSYVAPGERFPRVATTLDPIDRDVCLSPYDGAPGSAFETIGEVFSPERNPGRKRPFEIRRIMKAVIDQDHEPLERWTGMAEAEIAVVWDAHLGGRPVSVLGFESRPVPRAGLVPADGPEAWTAGTLFPKASKKIARALNAASGNRPVVVLANLSGFDGSPESMRALQLEFGAEIGRAVVNFSGPIVFSVISRYHGGAFVVFSRLLNESMEVSALEHTYASVIGGAPAAAVVFAGEVDKRAKNDPRVKAAEADLRTARGAKRAKAQARLEEVLRTVHSEKLGEVALEFDTVHSVERALEVGSIQSIVAPQRLRPYLVDAVERGVARELANGPGPRPFPDWRHLTSLRASAAAPDKKAKSGADAPAEPPPAKKGSSAASRREARDN